MLPRLQAYQEYRERSRNSVLDEDKVYNLAYLIHLSKDKAEETKAWFLLNNKPYDAP